MQWKLSHISEKMHADTSFFPQKKIQHDGKLDKAGSEIGF